jgi:hypothetical protein
MENETSMQVMPMGEKGMQFVAMLMQSAVNNNVPPETLEKIMAVRRELKGEWARDQFIQAMMEFQSKCPAIGKDKPGATTNAGKVAYKYAPFEDIVEQTKDLIKECGFSYMFRTVTPKEKVDAVFVECVVRHQAGHEEATGLELPFGTKTSVMSETQAFAATVTYGKRYAFLNAFGIVTKEPDIDGFKTVTIATEKQMEKIKSIVAKSTAVKLINEAASIRASAKYSDEQKEKIIGWMDERMKALPDGQPLK